MTCGRCGISGESKHFSAAECCEALKDQLAGAVGEIAALKSQRTRLQACPSCGEHLIDKVAAEVLDELFKPVRERLENVGLALGAERDALKAKVEELERKDIALAAGIDEIANSRARAWIEAAALRSALQELADVFGVCASRRTAPELDDPARVKALKVLQPLPQSPGPKRHEHVFDREGWNPIHKTTLPACICGAQLVHASPGPAPEAK